MRLSALDWIVIATYLVGIAAVGFAFTRRSGRSLSDYFVAGRSLPWWLAGTSMVATTFAADTPLAVTGMVARHGVAGNWLWWSLALSGILTVFFFSRLWRRAGVVTDAEFAEIRYSGKPAAALRAVRSLYLAIPINLIIMAWVTRAMATIMEISLGIEGWKVVMVLFLFTAAFSTLAGLWGVVATDFIQFAVAMIGSIVLAVVAVQSVGGLDSLTVQVTQHFGSREAAISLLPPLDASWLPIWTLLVFVAIQWWAAWYPGAEPGGGGYVAQRMLATKDERHSLFATLWFNVAHYAVRPWPWILVALVSVVRYGDLENPEEGFVLSIVDLLPSPLRGLLIAAFAAAYISTISTHLNWGASYLVNDIYARFINRNATDRQQVIVARLATLVLMALALVAMRFLDSVEQGWKILLAIGAGTGFVLILRWYWWRLNAWSEISAMVASFVTSMALQYWFGFDASDSSGIGFAVVMLWTVGVTIAVSLVVTLLTSPEPDDVLQSFYKKVRPGGPGWRRTAAQLGLEGEGVPGGWYSLVNWIAACIGIYAAIAGVGHILMGTALNAAVTLALGAMCFWLVARNLKADKEFASERVDSVKPIF